MKVLMNMADNGLLPDRLIRFGIHHSAFDDTFWCTGGHEKNECDRC